jgi:CheY-like chemotaxis protein
MSPEVQAHAFEPFFTTKPRSRGTGLGLATVLGIVKQSGGHITLSSEPDRGTVARILLPRAEGASPAEENPSANAPAIRGSGTVLVVEDESVVHEVAEHALREAGFDVLVAEDAATALSLVPDGTRPLRLLLTDVVLPGDTDGPELARRITQQQPHLPVLFMSGYTDTGIVKDGVLDTEIHFLPKPFTPDQLLRKVAAVLAP